MSASQSSTLFEQTKAWILDLPTELQQHITSFVPVETILQMRLTCKTFESVTLDIFAQEYISDQEMFLLDPVRLTRVNNLLSTPHLANGVQRVSTTLCAADSMCMPEIVPRRDEEHVRAQNDWLEAYEMAQYNQHLCSVEAIPFACEDILRNIISRMASTNCSLVVDVQAENYVYGLITKCRPQLVAEIIKIALREGCNVDGLKFSDDYALKAGHFEQGGIFRRVAERLHQFSYLAFPKSEGDLQTPWTQQHWRVIPVILQAAEQLNELELGTSTGSVEVGTSKVLHSLCSAALATANLPRLRILQLSGTIVPKDVLIRTLQSCATSLMKLRLCCVGVTGSGDVWSAIFKLLDSMPGLEELNLMYPFKRPLDDQQTQEERFIFLDFGKEEQEQCADMAKGEYIAAKPFLSQVVKRGVQYGSFRG